LPDPAYTFGVVGDDSASVPASGSEAGRGDDVVTGARARYADLLARAVETRAVSRRLHLEARELRSTAAARRMAADSSSPAADVVAPTEPGLRLLRRVDC
jgi:hypothetical protein